MTPEHAPNETGNPRKSLPNVPDNVLEKENIGGVGPTQAAADALPVPDFYPLAKRKLDALLVDGWSVNGYAVIKGEKRGFVDFGGFVGWWLPEYYPGHTSDDGRIVEALREALDFVNEASGAALGVAMSGSNHPNPDGVLMDLSRKAMDLANRLSVALSEAGGGS